MKVLIKEVLNEKEGKNGWKTVTLKIKGLDKAAKELGNEVNLSVAPDNKVKFRKSRELILSKPKSFFGSYYFKLSSDERAKSKQGGGNFKNYHQTKEEKPTKVKKQKNNNDESNQLQYYVNSTMRLVCAKIEGGDKKLSKLSPEELIDESIRLAKKLYKKIHNG